MTQSKEQLIPLKPKLWNTDTIVTSIPTLDQPIRHAFKPVEKNLPALPISESVFNTPAQPNTPPFINAPSLQLQFPYAYYSYSPNNVNHSQINRPDTLMMSGYSQPTTYISLNQANQPGGKAISPPVNTMVTTQVGKYWINEGDSYFQDNCLTLNLKDSNDLRRFSRHLVQKYNEHIISHLLQKKPIERKISEKTTDFSIKLYFKPELNISSKEEAIDSLKTALESKTKIIKKGQVTKAEELANKPQESNTSMSTTTTFAAPMQVEPVVSLTKTPHSPLIANSLFRVASQTGANLSIADRQQFNIVGWKRKRDEDDETIEEILTKKFKFETPTPFSDIKEDTEQLDTSVEQDNETSRLGHFDPPSF